MTSHVRKAIWVSLTAAWLVGGGCKVQEICDDGIDNDDDGLIDCDDPDCQDYYDLYQYCMFETDCSDEDDDDFDGDVDCEDSDCEGDDACDEDGSGGNDPGSGGGAGSGGAGSGGAGSGGDEMGGSDSGGAATGGSATGGLGGGSLGGAGGEGTGGGSPITCPTPSEAEEGQGYVDVGSLSDFTDFTQSSCQADGSGADIPLYYVVPTDGTLTVQTYSTYGDTDVSVRTDCGDPDSELPLACAADLGTGMQETIELQVDAEQTLFIIVSGANASVDAAAYLQLELE